LLSLSHDTGLPGDRQYVSGPVVEAIINVHDAGIGDGSLSAATWGSQSWLQPPFAAAPRSTTETDRVVAKPRRLNPGRIRRISIVIGC